MIKKSDCHYAVQCASPKEDCKACLNHPMNEHMDDNFVKKTKRKPK